MADATDAHRARQRLRPYVSGLALHWLETNPGARHRAVPGSLAFVDISGFTALTEKLATKGKVGAEEMSDLLNAAFADLLEEAYFYGASLVKWGGDAVLLLFEGDEHAALACRAAYEMRRAMRTIGRLRTSVGMVQLRMSVGIHSGTFDFFLSGRRHHELLVAGPAATLTARMEQAAEAGEIVVSADTADRLPSSCVGAAKGDGFLLRTPPRPAPRARCWVPAAQPAEPGSCLDPAIRDQLLTEVGDSEHRQVAVGFLEVSGVDELLARQGPGAVASALDDLIVVVQEECAHHSVSFWETDISADGFKVMLVAGAPRSSGHDEEGLLRAARTILDRHKGPVRLRIGVNCGRVFSGGFGPPFRRTWSVKGDAVNLAARVMGKADGEQLVATEALLRRVNCRVEAELLPPFMVKGKRQAVRAAKVSAVSGDRAVDTSFAGPFVGRRTEMDALMAAARAAATGHGSGIAVIGDPGIGKSRLVDHACRRLPDTDVLRSFASAYESSTPYFAVQRLMRAAIRLGPDAPDAYVVGQLRRVVDEKAPHLAAWLPLLAVPMGLDLPDTRETAEVAEQFRLARTQSLVTELLAAALDSPTVFVVDDIHDADDASVATLARIAAETPSRPWVLIVVGRELPAALTDVVREIAVPPLSDQHATELARETPGGAALASHVVRALVARAEGNPLFLRELVIATSASTDAELPGSLEELLAAQIDRLPPGPRRLLRAVSVLGTRFEESMASAVHDEAPTADEWRSLEHFLVRHADGSRRFRTTLARDAAYEGLPYRRRVELHGRTARDLEDRARLDGDDRAEALSLHCLAAQRYADAWRYSTLAGGRAKRMYANNEALTFYTRARTATRRLPDIPGGEVAELMECIGDLHARLADLEPAVEAFREARRRAPLDARLLRARVAISAAVASTRAGHPARTMRWFSAAEKEVELLGTSAADPAAIELRARIAVERAMIRARQGRHREASELCRRALELAGQAGSQAMTARALLILGINDQLAGVMADETRWLGALELFEQCEDLASQARVWNSLGIDSYYNGQWDIAVSRYERAREAFLRAGDEWNAMSASYNIAEILVDQGRLDDAEPLASEALRVWRAARTPWDIGYGAALMARLQGRRGNYAAAGALVEEAVAAYSASGERFDTLDAELRGVELLVLQGAAHDALVRLDHIERELRAALRASTGTAAANAEDGDLPPNLPHTIQIVRWRAYALGQVGRDHEAREQLLKALDMLSDRKSSLDVLIVLEALLWLDSTADVGARCRESAAQLGIVWSPSVPRSARALPTSVSVPSQRTAVDVTEADPLSAH